MAFLTKQKINRIGFMSVGKDVQISDKAVFYRAENISIGDYSRIDDFCILSAGKEGIHIGRYVHISCYAHIIGQGKVTMSDFSGISSRVAVFSSSDNYNGSWMTNPTLKRHPEVMNTQHSPVFFGKHVVVGAGSVVLPGAYLEDGVAIGSMSMVGKMHLEANKMYAGVPCREIPGINRQEIYEHEKIVNDKDGHI